MSHRDTIPYRVRLEKVRAGDAQQKAAKGDNELAGICRSARRGFISL